jgi:hypothetical protein
MIYIHDVIDDINKISPYIEKCINTFDKWF